MPVSFAQSVMDGLASSLELDRSLKQCFDNIQSQLPIDGIYINTYQPELKQIRHWASADRDGQSLTNDTLKLPLPLCQRLEARDRPEVLVINHIEHDPVTKFILEQQLPQAQSVMLLRLRCDDTSLGVVGLYANQPGAFNNRHIELARSAVAPFSIVTALHLQKHNLLADNQRLEQENLQLRQTTQQSLEVIGANQGLAQVMTQVSTIAPLESTVLINGDTGVGKEIIANAIHQGSPRASQPFIKVNCGAIPESLIDAELFGFEKGAFTGADHQKQGYFEQANNGTIFLDEIGELPPSVQVRLLRVLQEQTIHRVGGIDEVHLNIRVIAATHRDLKQMVEQHQFREDLWYRLCLFPITVPPLRQRRNDIPLLTHHFMSKLQHKLQFGALPQIDANNMQRLLNHPWPGNVRELENAVERAMIQYDGGQLDFSFLPDNEPTPMAEPTIVQLNPLQPEQVLLPLDEMTANYIALALEQCHGKIQGPNSAAELLGLHPNTLRSKMQKLGLRNP